MTVKPNGNVPAYELFRPGDQVIVHQLEHADTGAVATGAWPADQRAMTDNLTRSAVIQTLGVIDYG